MTVRFPCPVCQRSLKAKARAVGSHVTCPACKESIRVPDEKLSEVLLAMRNAERAQNNAEQSHGDFVVYDDEYLDIETGQISSPIDTVEESRITLPRSVVYGQAGLLAGMLLIGFVFGGLFGYSFGVGTRATPQSASLVSSLTYRLNEGTQPPDVGATVIVLPVQIWPDEKIDPSALRPDQPPPASNHRSVVAIQALGGAFARCDANGYCELHLPHSGEFFILLLSGNMRRGRTGPRPEEVAQIGRYFLLPTELLGTNQYSWSERKLEGKHRLKAEFRSSGTSIR